MSIQFIKHLCSMKRMKGMGIESYYNWARAVSPPPKNATNVEGCGCYIVEKDDRWTAYTYHHLCKDHMIEHNLRAQQFVKRKH